MIYFLAPLTGSRDDSRSNGGLHFGDGDDSLENFEQNTDNRGTYDDNVSL